MINSILAVVLLFGAQLGIQFKGHWTVAQKVQVCMAAVELGARFAEETPIDDTPIEAFRNVYGIRQGQYLTLDFQGTGLGAETLDPRYIVIYGWLNSDLENKHLIIHELGHAFDVRLEDITGKRLGRVLLARAQQRQSFPKRSDGGFYGTGYTWQLNGAETPVEEWADMFLGWTYDKWSSDDAGRARRDFMNVNMPSLVNALVNRY